jgi:hypothetical protein
MAFTQKMMPISVSISEKAKATLDRQARERGVSASTLAGQLFDMGFAALCAREKSMPVTDGDLDAIVSGSLLLWARKEWDTSEIAKKLGVPEATVVRMLDGWKDYRRGQAR